MMDGAMSEALLFAGLGAQHHTERVQAVQSIRDGVRRNHGRLRVRAVPRLFQLLAKALADQNWNVRRDTIALVCELLSGHDQRGGGSAASKGDDSKVELEITRLLPSVVDNFGDTKVAIRKGAAALLDSFGEHAAALRPLVDSLVRDGLENNNARVRKETLLYLNSAPLWERAAVEEAFVLIKAVVGRLRDVDQEVLSAAYRVASNLPHRLGETTFDLHIGRLEQSLQTLYWSALEAPAIAASQPGSRSSAMSFRASSQPQSRSRSTMRATPANVEFGLIPKELMPMLCDKGNWQARTQAVDELQTLVMRLEYLDSVVPHLRSLLNFLVDMSHDANLKVAMSGLQILGVLVTKVGEMARPFLEELMHRLKDMLGDNKIVVRQANTKLINNIMHTLSPDPVLRILLTSLSHSNWRVREEIVNVVILALSRFDATVLDFGFLTSALLPALRDPKSRVKYVAVEAYAVINNLIGSDLCRELLSRLKLDEAMHRTLSARFAAHELPSISSEGLVEHVVPVGTPAPSSSANSRAGSASGQLRRQSNGSLKKLPWAKQAPADPSDPDERARSYSSASTSSRASMRSVSGSSRGPPPPSTAAGSSGGGGGQVRGSYAQLYQAKLEGRTKRKLRGSVSDSSVSRAGSTRSSSGGYAARMEKKASSASHISGYEPSFGPRGQELSSSQASVVLDQRRRLSLSMSPSPPPDVFSPSPEPTSPFGGKPRMARPGSVTRRSRSSSRASITPDPLAAPRSNSRATSRDDLAYQGRQGTVPGHRLSSASSEAASLDDDGPVVLEETASPSTPAAGKAGRARPRKSGVPPATPQPSEQGPATPKRKPNPFPKRATTPKVKERSLSRSSTSMSSFPDPVVEAEVTTTSPRKSPAAATTPTPLPAKTQTGNPGRLPRPKATSGNKARKRSPHSSRQSSASEDEGEAARSGRRSPSPRRAPLKPRSVSPNKGRKEPAAAATKPPTPSRLPRQPSPAVATAPAPSQAAPEPGEEDSPPPLVRRSPTKPRATAAGKPSPPPPQQPSPVVAPAPPTVSGETSDVDEDAGPETAKARALSKVNQLADQEAWPGPSAKSPVQHSPQPPRRAPVQHSPPSTAAATPPRRKSPRPPRSPATKSRSPRPMRATLNPGAIRKPRRASSPLAAPAALVGTNAADERPIKPAKEATIPHPDPQHDLAVGPPPPQASAPATAEEPGASPSPPSPAVSPARSAVTPSPTLPPSAPSPSPASKAKSLRKRKATKTPTKPRRSSISASSGNVSRSKNAEDYLCPYEEVVPLPQPETALRDAYALLVRGENQETWACTCDGLEIFRRLLVHHTELLLADLHAVVVATLKEVKNLRSSVSRVGMLVLGDFYELLGRKFVSEVDATTVALIMKAAGEASSFIREDADKALDRMVANQSGTRSLPAMLQLTGHKNQYARRTCAKYLSEIVGDIGPKVLVAREADRLLRTLGGLTQDKDQETRHFAKRALYVMMSYDGFDRALNKHLEGPALRTAKGVIDGLRQKGLGDAPGSKASSRNSTLRSSRRSRRPGSLKTARHRSKDSALAPVRAALGSSDWRERDEAIVALVKMTASSPLELSTEVWFDYLPRLTDMNSKVNVRALKGLEEAIPNVPGTFDGVVGELVPSLGLSLGSKNAAIRQSAKACLSLLATIVDPASTTQAFCSATKMGNDAVKLGLIPHLEELAGPSFATASRLAEKHLVPLAVSLLDAKKTQVRTAGQQLCLVLYDLVGPDLLATGSLKPPQKAKLAELVRG